RTRPMADGDPSYFQSRSHRHATYLSAFVSSSRFAHPFEGGKDYAKTVINQSKPGNIEHKIRSLHQKPDQRAFFYNNQANEAKCQKIESSRSILAIYPKSKSREKEKSKFKG
nr:hypothetical protein [Tanacetum cinerariifolium]